MEDTLPPKDRIRSITQWYVTVAYVVTVIAVVICVLSAIQTSKEMGMRQSRQNLAQQDTARVERFGAILYERSLYGPVRREGLKAQDKEIALKRTARELGCTTNEVQASIDRYSAATDVSNLVNRAQMEFIQGKYGISGPLFAQAADDAYRQSQIATEEVQQEKKIVSASLNAVATNAVLSAESYRAGGKLVEALTVVDKAVGRVTINEARSAFASLQAWRGRCHGELALLAGEDEAKMHAKQSVEANLLSLSAIDELTDGERWAAAHGNLAMSLVIRSHYEEPLVSRNSLSAATNHYHIALNRLSGDTSSQWWRTSEKGLGYALSLLAPRVNGTGSKELLLKAVEALDLALGEKELLDSDELVGMEDFRGSILDDLAEMSEGAEAIAYLSNSLSSYDIALAGKTLERDGNNWARMTVNKGVSFWHMGRAAQPDEARKWFGKAICAFNAALRFFEEDSFPQGWADTHGNLGDVYLDLVSRTNRAGAALFATNAIHSFSLSLKIYSRHGFPERWAQTKNNLGAARIRFADNIPPEAARLALEAALVDFAEAQEVATQDHLPVLAAQLNGNMAEAYRMLAELQIEADARSSLNSSIRIASTMLQYPTTELPPRVQATAHMTLGGALEAKAKLSTSAEREQNLKEAKVAYLAARDGFNQASPFEGRDAEVALKRVEGLIADQDRYEARLLRNGSHQAQQAIDQ